MKKKYIAPHIEQETIDITSSMLSTSDSNGIKAELFDENSILEEYLKLGESTNDADISFAD